MTPADTLGTPRQGHAAKVGGHIAGRYRVEHALGEGGMAAVWQVYDEETGQKLALKRLTAAEDARQLALFEREFHTLASLRHPSMVQAYDYGADALGPYYTMELLEGSDLSTLAPRPWAEVCQIIREVASGVALLHARRLVHRDLSARNVWLTSAGQVKLLDFGTLAAFGRASEIAGTPALIAPEALRGGELDQRTDLYALGALAYFLITGRYPFPARDVSKLEGLWQERPRPPSQRVAELSRDDLPEVPAALDALVESLLSVDMLARPVSAAALIDRLTAIASLEPERPVRLVEAYFQAPAFTGRTEERRVLREAFSRASQGQAQAVVVESAEGLGRSRLLGELSFETRLSGATVLHAEVRGGLQTHDVVEGLCMQLCAALPVRAREAAAPYAPTLGHLSEALRERLGLAASELAAMPQTHGETRMRVQAALRDWFLDLARDQLLVILADDLDRFDEGSAAWLAALGRQASAHQLLIVASVPVGEQERSLPVQAFCQGARSLSLEPLSAAEMSELFRSVFGEVQYLERLVDRVHQRAAGNPGHALELAVHLSRQGLIAYADGTWLLPLSLDENDLPKNRLDAEIGRLAELPEEARRVGRAMAVHEGVLSSAMAGRLVDEGGQRLSGLLQVLVDAGVLARTEEGYHFSRDSLRAALRDELSEVDKKAVHRRLGALLLEAPDLSELERLKAGVHLLEGGDDRRGTREVAQAAKHYGLVDLADLGPTAPFFEAALAHYDAAGRSPYERAVLLAPLALGGYYADNRLATRYGPEAVDVLQRLVGLSTARRLAPFLGRKLGLLLALLWAALGFAVRRRDPRVPTFKQAMMMLFNCVAALTGASAACLDPDTAERYARVLQPMTALGPNHVATFMYEFCQNLVRTTRDHSADVRARWLAMIERLDQPEIAESLGDVHVLYLAGALYACGIGECRRDDSDAPRYADRLERFGLKLYEMSADQLRMFHHANRGEREAQEHYRVKVETHAIQRGTGWLVEIWMYASFISVYVRTEDVAALKQCVEQLKRLSEHVPVLEIEHARALASYLVLRGSPEEGLAVMDAHPEQPCARVGWIRGQGVRARALNELGRHGEARSTCLQALSYLAEEDLTYAGNNLGVLIELARAEAHESQLDSAEGRLRDLVREFAPFENPLTLGALYEALAEVARLRGDEDAVHERIREVERWFRPTRQPALVARCERLANILREVGPEEDPADVGAGGSSARLMTVLHNLRHGGDTSLTGSAEWSLKQLSGLTELTEAYLYLWDAGEAPCLASVRGGSERPAIDAWVHKQLTEATREMATCVVDLDGAVAADNREKQLGDQIYRLHLLREAGDYDRVVGALVVPRQTVVPYPVLAEIAARIQGVPSLDRDHPSAG